MKFIRAFWGNIKVDKEKYITEIRHAGKSRVDELVYVWGDDNYNILTSFGYQCHKMSSEPFEYGDDLSELASAFFMHKIQAIRRGIEMFGEVIFLDWDCWPIKQIDDEFFKNLKNQNKRLQIPLYSFPKEGYLEEVFKRWPKIPEKYKKVAINHYENVKMGFYDFGNNMVIPCTCFVYCSDITYFDEYMEVYENNKSMYSEECLWYLLLKNKCETLDEYIKTYEPLVCNAKHNSHFNQKDLYDYMGTIIQKDLYYIHD
jgi:hypothetical protein